MGEGTHEKSPHVWQHLCQDMVCCDLERSSASQTLDAGRVGCRIAHIRECEFGAYRLSRSDHFADVIAKARSAEAALRTAATWLDVDAAMGEEMRIAVTESVLFYLLTLI